MFQYDFGPPKHVLHLVWSVLGISTAIKTALKVAIYDFFDGPLAPLNGQFMEKVNHYNRTKHKESREILRSERTQIQLAP